jgi:hypothetical protein
MIDALRRAADVGRFCSIRGFEAKVERKHEHEAVTSDFDMIPQDGPTSGAEAPMATADRSQRMYLKARVCEERIPGPNFLRSLLSELSSPYYFPPDARSE